MKVWQVLFSPKGRIRRRDWWIYSFGAAIVFLVIYVPVFAPIDQGALLISLVRYGQVSLAMVIALAILILTMQYVQFCLLAKRWHDRNRPAAFAAIIVGFSLFDIFMSYVPRDGSGHAELLSKLVHIALIVVDVWALVECGGLDGMKETNQYGPSPKYITQQSDVF